eukprot:8145381-Ditylum_brightwellii.AAC.1
MRKTKNDSNNNAEDEDEWMNEGENNEIENYTHNVMEEDEIDNEDGDEADENCEQEEEDYSHK